MGLLEGLGRMIAGKPVFTVEDTTAKDAGFMYEGDSPTKVPRDELGNKLVPEVAVPHVNAQLNGEKIEVLAEVLNDSEYAVYVDKIQFLGQTTELDRQLSPGHGHAFEIYNGPAFTDQPPVEAEVHYRLADGNEYFAAHFRVDFAIQDEHYMPGDLHLDGPIRDI